jgi:hypothetical protein
MRSSPSWYGTGRRDDGRGPWGDSVVGLNDVRADIATLRTPDGTGAELVGEVAQYEDIYRLSSHARP